MDRLDRGILACRVGSQLDAMLPKDWRKDLLPPNGEISRFSRRPQHRSHVS